jgi:NADH dehydrogenase FAD-containing subunit
MAPITARRVLSFVSFGSLLSGVVSHPQAKPPAVETYDYVIIGGGLTGLVVANRLSEMRDSALFFSKIDLKKSN